MCNLNMGEKVQVRSATEKFVQKGKPFSGYDVYKALLEEVKSTPGASVPDRGEISRYVRELFNNRDLLFCNDSDAPEWISWPTPAGFLLYAKVPSSLRRAYSKMVDDQKT